MPVRSHPPIGIELHPTGARLAQVSSDGARVERLTDLRWQGPEDARQRLREALSLAPPEVPIAVSLPNVHVWSRLVELPALKKAESETALASRLNKFLPYRSEAWSLSSREAQIKNLDPSRRAWFATLASTGGIKAVVSLLEPFAARWETPQLELPARSLLRWLLFERPEMKQGIHVGVHAGDSELLVWACSEGTLVLSREYDLAPVGPGDPSFDSPLDMSLVARQVHGVITWLRLRTLSCELAPADLVLSGRHAGRLALIKALENETRLAVITLDNARLQTAGGEVACGLSLTGFD